MGVFNSYRGVPWDTMAMLALQREEQGQPPSVSVRNVLILFIVKNVIAVARLV